MTTYNQKSCTISMTTKEFMVLFKIIHQLNHTMHEEEAVSVAAKVKSRTNVIGVCPDCGAALWHEECCAVCHACGYSKCS